MRREEEMFVIFLKIVCFAVVVFGVAVVCETCNRHDRTNCREMMAVTHSLRDSLVIADVSSATCSNMVKDSLVARAKRQP